MKVTQETIDEHVKNGNMVPHPIEGIPDGMCFKKEMMVGINDLIKDCLLIAYKIGSEQVSFMPVLYRKNASEDEIKLEFKQAEAGLLQHYKKL